MVRFYGHASILIEIGGTIVVTDPWFSPEGAFLSSWFQFPDNTDLDLTPVRNADYIVISHEHEDHLDVNFLKTISPRTKVVIPKYHEDHLYREIEGAIPNEIILAESRETIRLGSIAFTPVIQQVPIWDDCALVFETPEGVIADLNDMKSGIDDTAWIKKRFPNIKYLFIQYSAASWHPYAYNYPLEDKHRFARSKSKNKFSRVKGIFEALNPEWLIPCAGPACFLDDDLFYLNHSDFFPTQRDFYEFARTQGFDDRVVVLLPGEDFEPKVSLDHPAFHDRDNYLRKYQARRVQIITRRDATPEPEGSMLGACEDYFLPLMASSKFFREKIGGSLLLSVSGGEKILVDFKNGEVRPAFLCDKFFYRFQIEKNHLAQVLSGKLPWETLLLSLRMGTHRIPDNFNEYLFILLRYGTPEGLRRYELWEKDRERSDKLKERFELDHEGSMLSVQRYCPHALGDLAKGIVENGVLTCPVHGWRFCLSDGHCLNNDSSIKVEHC